MKPRPKFCIGEEVSVTALSQPDIEKTEVVDIFWCNMPLGAIRDNNPYLGWGYRVAGQANPRAFSREHRVRKLPPEERTQWSDCEWQPNNNEVSA